MPNIGKKEIWDMLREIRQELNNFVAGELSAERREYLLGRLNTLAKLFPKEVTLSMEERRDV